MTLDAETVIHRLEEAAITLASLPPDRVMLGVKTMRWEVAPEPAAATDANSSRVIRLPAPSARAVTMMDEAFGWLPLIENVQHRRLVQRRAMIHPWTRRPRHTWRALGVEMRCSHEAARQWHAQAVNEIVKRLRTPADSHGQSRPKNLVPAYMKRSFLVDKHDVFAVRTR